MEEYTTVKILTEVGQKPKFLPGFLLREEDTGIGDTSDELAFITAAKTRQCELEKVIHTLA